MKKVLYQKNYQQKKSKGCHIPGQTNFLGKNYIQGNAEIILELQRKARRERTVCL